jgi:hypothetical protein
MTVLSGRRAVCPPAERPPLLCGRAASDGQVCPGPGPGLGGRRATTSATPLATTDRDQPYWLCGGEPGP